MRNTTCIICLNEFKPREGKLYCSNACKQKSYSDKHHSEIKIEEKEKLQNSIKKQLEFSFTEFIEYTKKYDDGIKDFKFYCFFRKNILGTPSIEEIYSYIDNFDWDWWNDFQNDESSIARKKYNEFVAKFFSDDVSIYFSNNITENNKGINL